MSGSESEDACIRACEQSEGRGGTPRDLGLVQYFDSTPHLFLFSPCIDTQPRTLGTNSCSTSPAHIAIQDALSIVRTGAVHQETRLLRRAPLAPREANY